MKQFIYRNAHWFVGACALVLMVIGIMGILISLQNQRKIDRNYESNQAFKTRTIDRWDYLQRLNPGIKVPLVEEPIDKPHLSPSDLERQQKGKP